MTCNDQQPSQRLSCPWPSQPYHAHSHLHCTHTHYWPYILQQHSTSATTQHGNNGTWLTYPWTSQSHQYHWYANRIGPNFYTAHELQLGICHPGPLYHHWPLLILLLINNYIIHNTSCMLFRSCRNSLKQESLLAAQQVFAEQQQIVQNQLILDAHLLVALSNDTTTTLICTIPTCYTNHHSYQYLLQFTALPCNLVPILPLYLMNVLLTKIPPMFRLISCHYLTALLPCRLWLDDSISSHQYWPAHDCYQQPLQSLPATLMNSVWAGGNTPQQNCL